MLTKLKTSMLNTKTSRKWIIYHNCQALWVQSVIPGSLIWFLCKLLEVAGAEQLICFLWSKILMTTVTLYDGRPTLEYNDELMLKFVTKLNTLSSTVYNIWKTVVVRLCAKSQVFMDIMYWDKKETRHFKPAITAFMATCKQQKQVVNTSSSIEPISKRCPIFPLF